VNCIVVLISASMTPFISLCLFNCCQESSSKVCTAAQTRGYTSYVATSFGRLTLDFRSLQDQSQETGSCCGACGRV